MSRKPSIDNETALRLKQDMWDGMNAMELQEKYQVSYQTCINIRSGRGYSWIPWPDGTAGAMSDIRQRELKGAKKYHSHMKKAQVSYVPGGTGRFLDGRELEPWELHDPIIQLKLNGTYEEVNQRYIEKFGHSVDESFRRFYKVLERYNHEKEQEKHRERMAAFDEHERKMQTDPEYREAYLAEKERKAEEARKLNPPRYNLPNDQCDPEANQKVPWDEVLALAGDLKIVQIAEQDEENSEPALKPAIQIVFKLLSQRQWKEDHCLRMIYQVKKKIENFWEAQQDAA